MPELADQIYKQEISYEIPTDIPARYLAEATPLFTAFGCTHHAAERQEPCIQRSQSIKQKNGNTVP